MVPGGALPHPRTVGGAHPSELESWKPLPKSSPAQHLTQAQLTGLFSETLILIIVPSFRVCPVTLIYRSRCFCLSLAFTEWNMWQLMRTKGLLWSSSWGCPKRNLPQKQVALSPPTDSLHHSYTGLVTRSPQCCAKCLIHRLSLNPHSCSLSGDIIIIIRSGGNCGDILALGHRTRR